MTWKRSISGLLLACFITSLGYAKGDRKSFQVYDFSKGVDTFHNPFTLDDGFVQDSLNVLFDSQSNASKRSGYTVSWSTKGYSYTGLWTYTDSNNTSWQLARSSDQITASNLAGTVVKVSTVSSNNLVGEVNAFGSAYFVDQTQGVYYWNGSSTTYVSGSPKGSIIGQFHGRVWVVGAAVPSGNQLYGSKFGDGTTWATGINSTDPVQYTVGLNDNFDNLTAEYVYLDTLYLFKHYSIFALYGFDQTNFQISQLTQECGCVDGGSIQTFNSGLKFASARGIEDFNGYTCKRISGPIKNKVDPAIQSAGFAQQSWALQNQSDWQSGALFQLNAVAAAPALVISTQAAFSGADNTQANWQAGTNTNLDTTTNAPFLQLSQAYGSVFTDQSNSTNNSTVSIGNGCSIAESFTSSTPSQILAQRVTSIDVLCANNSGSDTDTLSIRSDSGGTPGSVLVSATFQCPSSAGFQNVPLTPTVLSNNTVYWIYLQGPTSSVNNTWSYNNTGGSSGAHLYSTCTGSFPNFIAGFKENIQTLKYATTGLFTSRVFDVGASTNSWLWNWSAFNTTQTNNGQTIAFATRVSSASTGPWDAFVPVTPGSTIGSGTKEFVQYVATMTTTDTSLTPVLSSSSFSTSIMSRSSGTFSSPIHSLGTISSFGNFSVTDLLNDGSIAFTICASTNATLIPPKFCAVQTPNSQITITTGTFVQWSATFTVTAATQAPTLNSGTVQWFTGNPPTPMSSTVWDNRYWLSLTTTTTDTANDEVLVLNSKGAWSLLDIHAGAFTQYKGSLYHADSRPTGNMYLDGQGYADNGSAINAFVKTKDLPLGGIASNDYLYAIYPSMLNLGSCVVTFQYDVDHAGTNYSLGSPLQSEFSTAAVVKLPFPINSSHQNFGNSINFTIGTNDAICGWEFSGFDGIFKERPVN